jgi:hypothetical protein
MLKSLIVLGCFLSSQAHANPSEQPQTIEISGESILFEGLPFVAVTTKEAGLTDRHDAFVTENQDYTFSKAQTKADKFCQSMNYVHAKDISVENLEIVEDVEGWVIDKSGKLSISLQVSKVSGFTWLALMGAPITYRKPMVFKSVTCVK